MSIQRRWRIFYLVVGELAHKYTKALAGGFVAGIVLSLVTLRLYPFAMQLWFSPVERIGLVGEYTPNNLPLSVQKDISLGLTEDGPDGAASPALAERWEATDSGKTFTFHLRGDLRWHNGKPVEAKDVNYNIKNVTLTVIDPHTLRATLNNSYSPFVSLVSKPIFQSGLRGFGPYKLASIRLNGDTVSYIKLVGNDLFDGIKRKTKEYRFYRTEAAAVLAFKLGEVDRLDELSSPYDLAAWGTTKVEKHVKYNHIVSLFFNLNDSLLADKTFRQALAYGVPKLEGESAVSPIPKTSWAYTDKVKKYAYDPAQVKKLFGSAKAASEEAQLKLSAFPQYADEAQAIADSWTKLGIPAEVRIVNFLPSDYQVLLSAQEVPPDPDQYPLWHSTQTQTNTTGLANVKIDKLLEDGRQELDVTARKKIYADFQRYLVEDAPAVFLHYQTVYSVSR